jgi:hypothetical protein
MPPPFVRAEQQQQSLSPNACPTCHRNSPLILTSRSRQLGGGLRSILGTLNPQQSASIASLGRPTTDVQAVWHTARESRQTSNQQSRLSREAAEGVPAHVSSVGA